MIKNVEPTSNTKEKFMDYFNMETNDILNTTDVDDVTVPSPDQGLVIGVYSALLVVGAVGNIAVFASLLRSRRRKSRVNLLMTHLVVADMMVTFVVIPLEIGWRTTNAWLAGNIACKFFLVLRAFGLYLSSNVLVCISVDRFFAIIYPLRLPVARKRSKMMLYCAWIVAVICSLPQSLVFQVMHHPKVPEFEQCVSFDAFSSHHQELAYNVFCLCAMYFLPLMVISVCYVCIFYEISKNTKENSEKSQTSHDSRVMLRRSDQRPLARARRRTLRMTVTIVTVFACCWMPYATMTLWYMVDRESAVHVSARLQDLFFVMAVSNSCMDPLVYGSYVIDPRNFTKAFRKICHSKRSEVTGINGNCTTKAKLSIMDSENPKHNVRVSRRFPRFEECSSIRQSVNSDPVPWRSRASNDIVLKQAHSCEMFVLHSPPERTFEVSVL